MLISVTAAACAAAALRLFLIYKFPMNNASDSQIYLELAQNWLHAHVYGLAVNGQLTPVDIRMPGYPALLAAVTTAAGASHLAISWVQVLVDLATCWVIALLAGRVATAKSGATRKRVMLAAFWLAAVCPFLANYTTGILTEVPAALFTAISLMLLGGALVTAAGGCDKGEGEQKKWSGRVWFWGGVAAGVGTLIRPDTPLVLVAASLVVTVMVVRDRGGVNWRSGVRALALMWIGMVLPLMPWAIRNWISLHEVQLLGPRYTQLPGELVPRGANAWTNTWLWRFRDVYLFPWKLDDEEIHLEDLPAYAFDSEQERQRLGAVMDEYNDSLTLSPEEDAVFAQVARERTARHAPRTYVTVPFKRIFSLWFTPRIELLPFSGDVWPVKQAWQDDREDLLATCGLTALGIVFVGMAVVGAWKTRASVVTVLLVAFCVIRTLFFLHYETPEPRYMLECYPAILALGAQVFVEGGDGEVGATGPDGAVGG
jgi:hypothetical protein